MDTSRHRFTHPRELADHLEAVARQLRDGQLATPQGRWPVPNHLKAKSKIVEKKGRLQLRLTFGWSTAAHYPPADKAALTEWKDRFKPVKKALARSFKALSQAAAANRLPDPTAMENYLRDSDRFEELSRQQWPREMGVYRDHVQNMKRAVDDGRLADFQHEVRDLRSSMIGCHRAFK